MGRKNKEAETMREKVEQKKEKIEKKMKKGRDTKVQKRKENRI